MDAYVEQTIEGIGEPEGLILSLGSEVQTYVGVKAVYAVPMNRLAYSELRGWALPEDENGEDEGYLVQYVHGGDTNVEGFTGYVSWSPKEVFEKSYSVAQPKQMVEETYQSRMKVEEQELSDKVEKLSSFLGSKAYANLCKRKQGLLREQLRHMRRYLNVLRDRME